MVELDSFRKKGGGSSIPYEAGRERNKTRSGDMDGCTGEVPGALLATLGLASMGKSL